MQQVVIAKPYQFVPPHHGTFCPWLLQKWLPGHTQRKWGAEWPECHGLEHLKASPKAGHGIILAPNHCRPCDPFVAWVLGAELHQPLYTMASAPPVHARGVQRWLLRRRDLQRLSGRPGSRSPQDRLPALVDAHRPLVIFPGSDFAGNDRLRYVMDGVAFIARPRPRPGPRPTAWRGCHPPGCLAVYLCGQSPPSDRTVLDMIEQRLGWLPHVGTSLTGGFGIWAKPSYLSRRSSLSAPPSREHAANGCPD